MNVNPKERGARNGRGQRGQKPAVISQHHYHHDDTMSVSSSRLSSQASTMDVGDPHELESRTKAFLQGLRTMLLKQANQSRTPERLQVRAAESAE